jgi:2-methylcitrate dehydratase
MHRAGGEQEGGPARVEGVRLPVVRAVEVAAGEVVGRPARPPWRPGVGRSAAAWCRSGRPSVIEARESAVGIIDKGGLLTNPADRDHCLQYMVAVALLQGGLTAADDEDEAAADPRIDWPRGRMVVTGSPQFSRDYLDPAKRSIGNAVRVVFRGGHATEEVTVEYPVGHSRRRAEGVPLLLAKFAKDLRTRLPAPAAERVLQATAGRARPEQVPVQDFVGLFVV